jgi:hypothetical protein
MWLAARMLTWSLLGRATALMLHDMLDRMTLPLAPFIYQAF